MASLQFDASAKTYRIRFRFGGRGYFRSLRTSDPGAAEALRGTVENTIRAIEQGWLALPDGVDPAEFLISGGKLAARPVTPGPSARPDAVTVAAMLGRYAAEVLPESKEANSLETEALHRGHLERLLGERPVAEVGFDGIQGYVRARSAEGRLPVTIRKELATLRMIWNRALRHGVVAAPVPWRMVDLEFPKYAPKEPFKTWAEIVRKIERENLRGEEAEALWKCLYLDESQVAECLEHVRRHAPLPFIHPMFALAAYTGARRGEILRALREDFDLDGGTVAVRQKKSDRSRTFTFRHVPVHPALAEIMRGWFARHPGGTHAICSMDGRPIGVRMGTKYFRRALKGSKWSVLHGFHVFRHSLASIMASRGTDQRIINEILGHSTEDMVRRYRHLFPRRKEETLLGLFGGQ